MPDTLTLSEMLTDLRAEVGHSLNVAHGTNQADTLKYLLKRVQKELYEANDWPDLMLYSSVPISAGDRYVAAPSDISVKHINRVWCQEGSEWVPVDYGINPEHYSLYDPDNDIRGFPVQRYRQNPLTAGTIEIWPIPSTASKLLFYGQKNLGPLVADADPSTLDGTVIVLFTAAEVLARQKNEDAGLKLQKAQQHLNSLNRNIGSQKRKPFTLGRNADGGRRPRAGIDYVPRT